MQKYEGSNITCALEKPQNGSPGGQMSTEALLLRAKTGKGEGYERNKSQHRNTMGIFISMKMN